MPFDATHPLTPLLDHSDCDGVLRAVDCSPMADALEELLPLLEQMGEGGGHVERGGGYAGCTRTFIAGLRKAAAEGEDVEFA